jgi:hypothetical protein
MRFERQRQANKDKRIPSTASSMDGKDVLERLVLIDVILDAGNMLPMLGQSAKPLCVGSIPTRASKLFL